jgi:glycosyltransferase involved in cell wall biosynthesis
VTRRICHCLSSLHVGGAGRLLLSNLAPLREHGFESSVVYLVPRHDLLPGLQRDGWRVECLDHRGGRHAVRTLARLRRHLRREGTDLVHTHLWLDRVYGGLAARLAGLPVVTTLHAAGAPHGGGGPRAVVEDRIARWTVDRYVAVSGAARDFYVRERRGDPDRVEVVHSGVPVREIEAAEPPPGELAGLRERLGLPPGAPVLLHVGRLSPEKGQEHLLAALPAVVREHPDARLVLVGDGGDRDRLRALAGDLGVADAVRFPGRRSDVYRLLYLADLFLFTPRAGEGLGLALLEAMAAARPVVVFRTPALDDVLPDDGAGPRLDPGDPAALSRAVLGLLARDDRGRSFGLRGREIVRARFDARGSAVRLAEVYRRVLAETAGAPAAPEARA